MPNENPTDPEISEDEARAQVIGYLETWGRPDEKGPHGFPIELYRNAKVFSARELADAVQDRNPVTDAFVKAFQRLHIPDSELFPEKENSCQRAVRHGQYVAGRRDTLS